MRSESEIRKRLRCHRGLRSKAEKKFNDVLFNHHSKVCILLEWILEVNQRGNNNAS